MKKAQIILKDTRGNLYLGIKLQISKQDRHREYIKQWRLDNKERLREYNKQYWKQNKAWFDAYYQREDVKERRRQHDRLRRANKKSGS